MVKTLSLSLTSIRTELEHEREIEIKRIELNQLQLTVEKKP